MSWSDLFSEFQKSRVMNLRAFILSITVEILRSPFYTNPAEVVKVWHSNLKHPGGNVLVSWLREQRLQIVHQQEILVTIPTLQCWLALIGWMVSMTMPPEISSLVFLPNITCWFWWSNTTSSVKNFLLKISSLAQHQRGGGGDGDLPLQD